ncbi:MAG: ABC transporter substrate-binding protein [Magnetococcus sp. DMHC-6]
MASVSTFYDLYKIIFRKDAGFRVPSDLPNRRVATTQGSSLHYFVHNFLIDNQIKPETVDMLFLSEAQMFPLPLGAGQRDAFVAREPYISEAQARFPGELDFFSDPTLAANTLNLITLDSTLNQHWVHIAKILQAFLRTELFLKTNPQEVLQMLKGSEGMESDSLESRWSRSDHQVTLSQELILNMENIARWSIRNGLIDRQTIPNFVDLLSIDALESLKPEAVSVIH